MKIYFDVSTLGTDHITGVGVYMLRLLRQFRTQPQLELVPVVKPSRLKKCRTLERAHGFSVRVLFPWTGIGSHVSLYHGPDFKAQSSTLPRVVTVHDMVVFERLYNRPEFYERGIRELTAVLRSPLDAVIVNSEFTRSEVVKHFPAIRDKVHVTYLGCDRKLGTAKDTLELPSDYLLFLGTLEKRKNPEAVIKAFEKLRKWGHTEKLVLAGGSGFEGERIQALIDASPASEHIVRLDYVPEAKVSELYRRAKVFVFPSWYEGFGLPVLEAMALGCPVVTSRGGALEEVSGGAALLADPIYPEDIAEQTQRILTDSALRASLIAKGQARAAEFTWEKCALETIKIYEQVLAARAKPAL